MKGCVSYSVIRTRIAKNLLERYNNSQAVSDDCTALLIEFVSFDSFLLCDLEKKNGVEGSTDTISMVVQEVVQNSFKDISKEELQKWYNKLHDSWFNLQLVASKQDPEHLVTLQKPSMVTYNKSIKFADVTQTSFCRRKECSLHTFLRTRGTVDRSLSPIDLPEQE